MANLNVKKPIGKSDLWDDFKKQHPNLPEFNNLGDFLSWAIKQSPPIINPYKLWEAKLDFQATDGASEVKEKPEEEKQKKQKVKKERHEEYEAAWEKDDDPESKEEIKKNPEEIPTPTPPPPTPTPTNNDSWGTIEEIEDTTAVKNQEDNAASPPPTAEPMTSDQNVDLPQTTQEIKPPVYKELARTGDDGWGKFEPLTPSGQVQNSIEQWKESAPVDRPTKQAARYANNPRVLKPKLATARKASGIASKARKASWLIRLPYAIPIIAVVIIVVLLILVPVIVMGKASEDPIFAVQVGLNPFFGNDNPNQTTVTPTPPQGGETAKCNTNARDCLKNEFNFEVRGNATAQQMNDVFNLLSEVTVAPEYRKLLRSSGPTPIYFTNDSSKGGGCPARVQPNGNGTSTLTLYNYSLSDCSRTTRKSRLVHESGHILRNGHMRLFQEFENKAYNKDRGCYYREIEFSPSFFINTYSTSFASGQGVNISGSNESMAEFMALHVIPEGAYPRKCPVGYNWVIENIFGNYRF